MAATLKPGICGPLALPRSPPVRRRISILVIHSGRISRKGSPRARMEGQQRTDTLAREPGRKGIPRTRACVVEGRSRARITCGMQKSGKTRGKPSPAAAPRSKTEMSYSNSAAGCSRASRWPNNDFTFPREVIFASRDLWSKGLSIRASAYSRSIGAFSIDPTIATTAKRTTQPRKGTHSIALFFSRAAAKG